MNSSAIWSSRIVVTPARTSAASRSWQAASTSPAAAIASISPADLRTIPRRSGGDGEPLCRRRDGRLDLGIDLVHRALALDLAQEAALAVVVDQGGGLLIVDRQAVLNRLRPIVVALVEGAVAAGRLAHRPRGAGVEDLVPRAAARPAD